MNRETVVKYLRDAVPLGEHPTPHAEFITVRLDTVQAAADAIEAFDDDKEWIEKGLAEWRSMALKNAKHAEMARATAKGRDMRQATDEEIKAAFDRHLKASNLPAQIKNGDYRSGWVRQAWASFYSGWRRCEDRKMDNV